MRIVQLTDFYRPFIGGLERHVELLSHGLASRGHEVTVVTAATRDVGEGTTESGGVTVHRVRSTTSRLASGQYVSADRPFHPTFPDPAVASALGRLVREARPDVVHAHSWSVNSYLPLATSTAPPLVVTAHDYGLVCATKTHLRGEALCAGPSLGRCLSCSSAHYGTAKGVALAAGLRASRPLVGRAERILAVSGFVADRLGVLRDRHDRPVQVLPSFVPDDVAAVAAAAPRPAWVPDGDGYLLFVGALSAHKGVHVLLDAYRRLGTTVPLVMVGTRQADTPNALPPNVTLALDAPHAEVMAAMARASLVVVPSVWPDPLPMTVSEAQLVGTPVVASATGGIPEMVLPGETGVLVAPGDPGDLAGTLRDLLGDPARRAAMAEAAPRWAQQFTASAVIDRMEAVYAEAAASRAALAV